MIADGLEIIPNEGGALEFFIGSLNREAARDGDHGKIAVGRIGEGILKDIGGFSIYEFRQERGCGPAVTVALNVVRADPLQQDK